MRRLEEKDAKRMVVALNDKDVTNTMRISMRSFTLEECESYIQKANNDKESVHFAITDDNDNWVGTVSLKDINQEKKEAEYAILTAKEVHGKGYAQKATDFILDYAFNKLGLKKVYLFVSVNNVRANKFYQKYGFTFDRLEENGLKLGNESHDINWYYISK